MAYHADFFKLKIQNDIAKAKNWEAYASYYEDLVGDIDKSFQYLFGDGFVRAYEDQLQKLAISKKSRASSEDSPAIEPDQT